jgi:hypothetical protein
VTPLASIPESTDDILIPETVSGGRVWGAGATLTTGALLEEALFEMEVLWEPALSCELVSLGELVELFLSLPLPKEELPPEELVALQATRFKPTNTVRKTRRVFCRRLNRIRTTLYDYLNIGPKPDLRALTRAFLQRL